MPFLACLRFGKLLRHIRRVFCCIRRRIQSTTIYDKSQEFFTSIYRDPVVKRTSERQKAADEVFEIRKQILRSVINEGADRKERQTNMNMCLHLAVQRNDVTEAKFLLSIGADINSQNFAGNTCLHIAAENNYKDLINLLIEYGAVVNVKNKNAFSPLRTATKTKNYYAMGKLLVAETFPNNSNSR